MTRKLIVSSLVMCILLVFTLQLPSASAQIPVTITKTADGDVLFSAQLLTNIAATSNGQWVAIEGLNPFTIHVTGITTATAELRVSNNSTKPLDTAHEVAYPTAGASLTADGMWAIIDPVRWVKVRISAYTSGTINAYLFGKTQ